MVWVSSEVGVGGVQMLAARESMDWGRSDVWDYNKITRRAAGAWSRPISAPVYERRPRFNATSLRAAGRSTLRYRGLSTIGYSALGISSLSPDPCLCKAICSPFLLGCGQFRPCHVPACSNFPSPLQRSENLFPADCGSTIVGRVPGPRSRELTRPYDALLGLSHAWAAASLPPSLHPTQPQHM